MAGFHFENLILESTQIAIDNVNWVPLQGATGGSAALPGFLAFGHRYGAGDTFHYTIREVDVVGRPTGKYEYGIGTFSVYNGGNYLARSQCLGSSIGPTSTAMESFAAGTTKYISASTLAPNTDRVRFDWQEALGLNFAGTVAYSAASVPPAGWLKCNGAQISRATYARLFAAIGTQFGAGDGANTFALPDLRGEFIRSWDDGRTLDNGRAFGSVQGSQNLSHAHSLYDPGHAHGVADPGHGHTAWTDAQGNHNHHVNDPGHAHGFSGPNGNTTTPGGGAFAANPLVGRATDASGTGIWLNDGGNHGHNVGIGGSGTGIWIYGAGTGMSVYADGGSEARPRNVSMLAVIKF